MIVKHMKKLNSLPLIIIVMTSVLSCKGGNEHSTQFTAPLIAKCEEAVVAYFEKITSEDSNIDYDTDYFSKAIYSHQELIGVVNIYSDIEPIENLRGLWNNPFYDCYPTASTEIDLKQDITSSEILRKIYSANKQTQDFYISYKDKVMTIWFARHKDRVSDQILETQD